ncbi:serine protease [Sedimentitalea arenosa]|uniref:Trypsin-like peptidase domain-containing protein n=1 Tax=Sedimentitalea arenosa TaxID=2798803 RepID=A0A8J7J0U1_9RHOB|nr:serine protease [Arenibacterium arenosum]MBJ6371125.1 trypsin-like peptidase domain-containing protein [Arenibacterium arenosum]
MIRRLLVALVLVVFAGGAPLGAQSADPEVVWVQIEAHPDLATARQRAEVFNARLADVNGFSLGGSWYGILLGPYLREDAERVLRSYRADRLIPRDSFIAYSRNLGAQFWPEGANLLNRGAILAPPVEPDSAGSPTQPLVAADETPAEARRGERLLTAEERRELQVALRAAGFYNAAIDGAFGAGTRRSMADWQLNNGFEPTGVLTTAQRAMLMEQYNAPLISVGMRRVRDGEAGIAVDMPTDAVAFSRYEPPFAHYDASGDELAARVLLISQPGTRTTLAGLYDIMQTLEIVPLDGPRELSGDGFVIEGRGKGIVSHTEARLENGEIKGFTLIWPIGDEARRARVLDAMQASFERLDGVLDPATGEGAQAVDLVAGLAVRQPRLSRSGFYIDAGGTVATTADAVQNCTRITLGEDTRTEVLARDADLGVALLRPQERLAPMSVARLRPAKGRLQSNVAVSGYSYAGLLGGPTLTFGTVADVKGLAGEPDLTRLALNALPGDAGGPVLDAGGGVLGMLLPMDDADRKLPEDVSLIADAEAIRALLQQAGINVEAVDDSAPLTPNAMTRLASGMTVLVNCWD